jgi:hypothetical protein
VEKARCELMKKARGESEMRVDKGDGVCIGKFVAVGEKWRSGRNAWSVMFI